MTSHGFMRGGGEMGQLVRAFDWSTTVLGPAPTWPQSLKTAVSILLESHFGMLILWGREYIQIYNDPYRPILGSSKHPAIGQTARATFSESWHIIGPLFDQVMAGKAVGSEDWMVPLDRHGYLEECFFTFSYSPIRDESGEVGGIFVTVTETTRRVLTERRLLSLRHLAARASKGASEAQAWNDAAEALAANPVDLPFVGLYAFDEGGRSARLSGHTPVGNAEVFPADIEAGDAAALWPVGQAFAASGPVIVKVPARIGGLTELPWPEPVEQAALIPVTRPSLDHPYGVMVTGISPRLGFDDAYRDYVSLAAEHIASAIANARAHEEERRRHEALAELDRAKTTFFSNVSHEFRTPLTLILSPTEDALASPERALAGEDLVTVHRNELRLLKLVNTLLDFSRIEAGRARATFMQTDVAELTRDLSSAFRSAISRAGLEFDVTCPQIRQDVYLDREMWEKIVLNLLSNALKFTFEGAIRVALAERPGFVELSVSDTGVGIPSEELPRLFDRFHRVENSRGRTHEGSGIGLALVHELVKMHGGTLAVESEMDSGSTFTVSIPTGKAHLSSEQVMAPQAARPVVAKPYLEEALRWLPSDLETPAHVADLPDDTVQKQGHTIVVVDDNADMRDYVCRILGDRWNARAFGDGLTALSAIRAHLPALVIADIMMPGLDGFALLRQLRAGSDTRHVPVMLLSARAGEEARIDGLKAGADDYLAKPFSARELRARVENQILRAQIRQVEEAHDRRLLSIFQHAPVAIAILRGEDHVFEFVNEPYLQLIGRRSVLGAPIRTALPELESQGVIELLDRVYGSAEPYIGESLGVVLNRGPQGDPEEAFFKFVYQPMLDEKNTVEGIVVVAIEVTELTTARREAEAASLAKDEFIAMLSHELRSPLSPILTALQVMRLRNIDEAEREIAVIERQVRHMVSLIHDLLDVSRITKGKVELRKSRIELAGVVSSAIEMASPLLEARQHSLAVHVPQSGLSVEGDPERLAQVLSNLLTNAAKFTPPGGSIRLTGVRDREDVVLSVVDNGCGIDPEMLPRIFDLFAQARQDLDRSTGGLGLGLAIVKSLIGLHGGSVDVASEGPGRGSRFTVRLPFAPMLHSADEGDDTDLLLESARGRDSRILIVDDNEDAAEMLAMLIGTLGYQTRTAFDGPTALTAVAEFDPGIALLDIGLPVMDGYELAGRVKRSVDHEIRLIAITGYGQERDRAASVAAGFDAHLVKPVSISELTAILEQFEEDLVTD